MVQGRFRESHGCTIVWLTRRERQKDRTFLNVAGHHNDGTRAVTGADYGTAGKPVNIGRYFDFTRRSQEDSKTPERLEGEGVLTAEALQQYPNDLTKTN